MYFNLKITVVHKVQETVEIQHQECRHMYCWFVTDLVSCFYEFILKLYFNLL